MSLGFLTGAAGAVGAASPRRSCNAESPTSSNSFKSTFKSTSKSTLPVCGIAPYVHRLDMIRLNRFKAERDQTDDQTDLNQLLIRLWSLICHLLSTLVPFLVLLIEDVDARNLRDRCFRWNVPCRSCGPWPRRRWCRRSASAALVLFGLRQLRRRGEVRDAPALPVVEDDASRGVDVLKKTKTNLTTHM